MMQLRDEFGFCRATKADLDIIESLVQHPGWELLKTRWVEKQAVEIDTVMGSREPLTTNFHQGVHAGMREAELAIQELYDEARGLGEDSSEHSTLPSEGAVALSQTMGTQANGD